MSSCLACGGVGCLVTMRGGRYTVERCNTCGKFTHDAEAAAFARGRGIRLADDYPFVLSDQTTAGGSAAITMLLWSDT